MYTSQYNFSGFIHCPVSLCSGTLEVCFLNRSPCDAQAQNVGGKETHSEFHISTCFSLFVSRSMSVPVSMSTSTYLHKNLFAYLPYLHLSKLSTDYLHINIFIPADLSPSHNFFWKIVFLVTKKMEILWLKNALRILYDIIPVVPARGGAEVALKIYIRLFSSIELACAVRQPSPCVRALCESGVLFHMSHLKLHFALHTSHCTLHTPHFTLHTPHFSLARGSHLPLNHLGSHLPLNEGGWSGFRGECDPRSGANVTPAFAWQAQ